MKPSNVTTRLNEITTEAVAIYNRMEKDYARWGVLMIEAKKLVAYGQWGAYLEKHFPAFGKRQAQRYMELARDEVKTLTQITNRNVLKTYVAEIRQAPDEEYYRRPPPRTILERADSHLGVMAKIRDLRHFLAGIGYGEVDNLAPEVKALLSEECKKLSDFLENFTRRLDGKPNLKVINNG